MILILQPTSKRKKPGLVVLRTYSLIDEMTASQGLEMNTATQPIDALALANKIERLIPGDPLAAAPQPPTTEDSSVVEQPKGEQSKAEGGAACA